MITETFEHAPSGRGDMLFAAMWAMLHMMNKPKSKNGKRRVPIDVARGLRLREVRECCQLTQTELGKLIGVTKGAISQYENGEIHIIHERLEQIARAIRVPVATLSRPPGAPLPRCTPKRRRT